MYMTKATLDAHELVLRGGRLPESAYDSHKALWTLFGDKPDRTRDFVYRETGPLCFLVVSRREPEDRDGLWNLQIKPYEPRLRAGERLFFSLRANAVRKTRDAEGRQVRYDVVQDQRRRLKDQGVADGDMPSRAVLAQEAGNRWLMARQETLGLEIEPQSLMVEGYTPHRFRRKGARQVCFATLDFKGFATVQTPDSLLAALAGGVGPSKGFGCGLLTVMRG